MGWLDVTFKIGLAHPLMILHAANAPIQVTFSDTHNIVFIEPPGAKPNTEPRLGAFDLLILRVRMECNDEEGRGASLTELRQWHRGSVGFIGTC